MGRGDPLTLAANSLNGQGRGAYLGGRTTKTSTTRRLSGVQDQW